MDPISSYFGRCRTAEHYTHTPFSVQKREREHTFSFGCCNFVVQKYKIQIAILIYASIDMSY